MLAHRPGFNIVAVNISKHWLFVKCLLGCAVPQDLVSIPEVAQILGVSRQRVHQLIRAYPDFPEPEAVLAVGRIWKRTDIVPGTRVILVSPGVRPGTDGSDFACAVGVGTDSTIQRGPVSDISRESGLRRHAPLCLQRWAP